MKRVERRFRGTSPINTEQFGNIRNLLNDNQRIQLMPQNNGEIAPPGFRPNHPWLHNLGLVGLGGGLAALYGYRRPLMKMGQKFINYATDKFHHLFHTTNSTNSSQPIGNRAAF